MASVKNGNGSTEVQTDFNFILTPMINYCTSSGLCQAFLFHHSIESVLGLKNILKQHTIEEHILRSIYT